MTAMTASSPSDAITLNSVTVTRAIDGRRRARSRPSVRRPSVVAFVPTAAFGAFVIRRRRSFGPLLLSSLRHHSLPSFLFLLFLSVFGCLLVPSLVLVANGRSLSCSAATIPNSRIGPIPISESIGDRCDSLA